jgi:circadian clock protein KaiB
MAEHGHTTDARTDSDAFKARHELTLYVADTGEMTSSLRAGIEDICNRSLDANAWTLQVIDISDKPDIARREQIVAVPLLVIQTGGYTRRVIGRFWDTQQLRQVLMLHNECFQQSEQALVMNQQAQEMARQAEAMRRQARQMLESDPRHRHEAQSNAQAEGKASTDDTD